MRRRHLGEPSPPPDPRQSELLRLLLAWIDEAIGTAGAYETAVLREQARAAGQLSAAPRYLGHDHPLLPEFALGPDRAVDRILGYYDEDGEFIPGLAILTKRESEAMRFSIAGLEPWEVARAMTPGKMRRTGGLLAVKTVDEHLRSGMAKLRALLAP